jgi:6-phosphogluconate dehydrogenase (decarboxylating)
MVHNGLDTGLLQAQAEQYELLAAEDSIVDLLFS